MGNDLRAVAIHKKNLDIEVPRKLLHNILMQDPNLSTKVVKFRFLRLGASKIQIQDNNNVIPALE